MSKKSRRKNLQEQLTDHISRLELMVYLYVDPQQVRNDHEAFVNEVAARVGKRLSG
jgi:hypothetical protein